MKTYLEIVEKYRVFQLIKPNAGGHKEEVETTISVLEWVLQCPDCKKYPCDCDEPF